MTNLSAITFGIIIVIHNKLIVKVLGSKRCLYTACCCAAVVEIETVMLS